MLISSGNRISLLYTRRMKKRQFLFIKISTPLFETLWWLCKGEKDRGLLWLTLLVDRHIQKPSSSCFFDGNFDTELVLCQETPGASNWLTYLLASCSLPHPSESKTSTLYIFERPHIFFFAQATWFISAIPLFIQRHRCNILI